MNLTLEIPLGFAASPFIKGGLKFCSLPLAKGVPERSEGEGFVEYLYCQPLDDNLGTILTFTCIKLHVY